MAQSQHELHDEASSRAQITELIKAASHHDDKALQQLIDASAFTDCKPVDVQDPVTGYTPLHAAIASCHILANGSAAARVRDDSNDERLTMETIDQAHETIKLLLENGAIWNQLDRNGETPGCIAFRLGFDTLYQLMVDAGVRAELLLNRLDEYEELDDDGSDEAEANETGQADAQHQERGATEQRPQDVFPQATDTGEPANRMTADPVPETANYLSSALCMSGDKILDDKQNGVMMAWESDIMKQSADILLQSPELKILNIGFGMGIIDSHIQSHQNQPAQHHIIEAHPDVLQSIGRSGWSGRPGVTIHAGKWQDVLPKLLEDGITFDAVYFDTYAESYKDFKDFFTEHLLSLLEQDGAWSFFNGMGADRQITYDVYQKIVELDLFEAGFEVEWTAIELPDLSGEWDGVKRKYWNIQKYRLPVCKFMD